MATLKKTPDVLRSEVKNLIEPLVKQNSVENKHSIDDMLAELALRVGIGAGVTAIANRTKRKDPDDLRKDIEAYEQWYVKPNTPDRDRKTIETLKDSINENGLNFYNNWSVNIENDNLNANELILLQNYCTEFSDASFDFIETHENLGFRKHKDIQNIDYKEFSLTFLVDREMKIPKMFLKLINVMKNFTTGKMGYKEDYEFVSIRVDINDGSGRKAMSVVFHDCVFKNKPDMNFVNESAALQNFAVVFEYDYMEYEL